MKVIKHGNMYIEKEIECEHCGALLSYCKKDVIVDSGCEEVFGELHDWHIKYITCPECEERIYLTCKIDGEEILK